MASFFCVFFLSFSSLLPVLPALSHFYKFLYIVFNQSPSIIIRAFPPSCIVYSFCSAWLYLSFFYCFPLSFLPVDFYSNCLDFFFPHLPSCSVLSLFSWLLYSFHNKIVFSPVLCNLSFIFLPCQSHCSIILVISAVYFSVLFRLVLKAFIIHA